MTETTVEQIFQNPIEINQSIIVIGANRKITLEDVNKISKQNVTVQLDPTSYPAIEASFNYLNSCIQQHMPIYGVNTNFGDQVRFVDTNLKKENEMPSYEAINNRQENLIKSLATSLGADVSPEIVKTAMMLRSHCLSQGFSGITPNLISNILTYLNAGITPVVKCYGSIGASGDLIPLASIAAAMIGENVDVYYQGQIIKAPEALERAGLKPIKPQLRDGLAMINGTSFMTAIASLSLYKLKRLFPQLLSAIGMCLESLLVISSAYHPIVHKLKLHSGENSVNDFLLNFWQGSHLLSDLDELRAAHNQPGSDIKPTKAVQDYYSLRSVAQGFGPLHENLIKAVLWVEEEMNSVNDNPIIDAANQEIHHGANFMGYYVTEACDNLKTDIAQASTWVHALLANLVHPRKNHDLPANLVIDPGKNNGFRSMQLLAAALAVQNRKLAQSHQSYTLPTEGDNQDVNSLGTHAAFDFKESVDNLERLTAILLLTSVQALELRGVDKACPKSKTIYHLIRQHSNTLVECRPMSKELEVIIDLLQAEKL